MFWYPPRNDNFSKQTSECLQNHFFSIACLKRNLIFSLPMQLKKKNRPTSEEYKMVHSSWKSNLTSFLSLCWPQSVAASKPNSCLWWGKKETFSCVKILNKLYIEALRHILFSNTHTYKDIQLNIPQNSKKKKPLEFFLNIYASKELSRISEDV